jgi:hypothetical protein
MDLVMVGLVILMLGLVELGDSSGGLLIWYVYRRFPNSAM